MPTRDEKERRKALTSSFSGAERAAERLRVRERHGDDFADVSDAVEELFSVYERQPNTLTSLQQAVLDAWVLSGVVGNGGFDAWIRSNGHRADQTIGGLRLLGQTAVADAVGEALSITGGVQGLQEPGHAIEALSDAAYDRLDRLSKAVWDADESLGEAMTRAVRSDEWRRGVA